MIHSTRLINICQSNYLRRHQYMCEYAENMHTIISRQAMFMFMFIHVYESLPLRLFIYFFQFLITV